MVLDGLLTYLVHGKTDFSIKNNSFSSSIITNRLTFP